MDEVESNRRDRTLRQLIGMALGVSENSFGDVMRVFVNTLELPTAYLG